MDGVEAPCVTRNPGISTGADGSRIGVKDREGLALPATVRMALVTSRQVEGSWIAPEGLRQRRNPHAFNRKGRKMERTHAPSRGAESIYREYCHRMGNAFQLVESLIGFINDDGLIPATITGRIESILTTERMLFDYLYHSSVIDHVRLDEFAAGVVRRSCQILDRHRPSSDVALMCEPALMIHGDDAFHLGVLLAELLHRLLVGQLEARSDRACLLLGLKRHRGRLEISSAWNGAIGPVAGLQMKRANDGDWTLLLALVSQCHGRILEAGPGILRIEIKCSLRPETSEK